MKENFINDSKLRKKNEGGRVVEIGLNSSGGETGRERKLIFVEHLLCAKYFTCDNFILTL